MTGIPCVCLLRGSGEKDLGKHTVHGRRDSYTAISVCWSIVLVSRGLGVKRF